MLDWLAFVLVKNLGLLLCALPPSAALWLGERLGALAFRFQPKRTAIGIRNLQAAFPGKYTPRKAARIIHACYRQLGAGIFELLRLPNIDRAYIDRYLIVEGRERFDSLRASGRPVIFLAGHFGSWEMSSIAAALYGFPVVALARVQQKFPRLYNLLVSYRESKGCTIVHKGGGMRKLIAALDNNQMVGIVGDQASRRGMLVSFFGRPALFATGPFEMAVSRKALIVPVFIHRLKGPSHRLVIEPPFEVSGTLPKEEAIRQAIEHFTGSLARHITESPSQWLWMHKRWKHTPARRVLVISDGKTGHTKQSLAVVSAIAKQKPQTESRVVEIRFRRPLGRLLALLWSCFMPKGWGASACLFRALTRESAVALLSAYADVVVSCGSATHPVNVLASRYYGARSIALMNPSPLPLAQFDLVIAPAHDQLPPRSNVVSIVGAIAEPVAEAELSQAAEALAGHPAFRKDNDSPQGRVVGLLVGGNTLEFVLTDDWAGQLAEQLKSACRATNSRYVVTTSRRTPASAEERFAQALGPDPRCALLLLAGRHRLNGTMPGILGLADIVVVTSESISMITESCSAGRRVIVVSLPCRSGKQADKHEAFLQGLKQRVRVDVVPVEQVHEAIVRALGDSAPFARLDNTALIRSALEKVL